MLRDRKRVIWYEGMGLDPHHFQQWDRYHRSTLHARLRMLAPFEAGLAAVEVDRERLANGEFVLRRCTAVMPDGLLVDLPEADEPPPPRSLADAMPANRERVTVYLATPLDRPDGSNVLLSGNGDRQTRYTAATVTAPDETTGMDLRDIEVGRLNLEILFSTESLASYTVLPVAEVVRSGSGSFELDDRFIPPCNQIAGSGELRALTRRVLERLVGRHAELTGRQRSTAMQREFSPADALALALLGVLNTHIPLLNHYQAHPEEHPRDLYLTLLALAGGLSACVPEREVDPRELPTYSGTEPTACFRRISEVLDRLLGGAAPKTNFVQIPLQKQREGIFVGAVEPDLLDRAQFFLVARSEAIAEASLVQELPAMLRIASPQTIDAVLGSYTRGLPVAHTHRLPSGLPVDHQANYFQLQKSGPYWDRIVESRGLALFVPERFRSVDLQLIAVPTPAG